MKFTILRPTQVESRYRGTAQYYSRLVKDDQFSKKKPDDGLGIHGTIVKGKHSPKKKKLCGMMRDTLGLVPYYPADYRTGFFNKTVGYVRVYQNDMTTQSGWMRVVKHRWLILILLLFLLAVIGTGGWYLLNRDTASALLIPEQDGTVWDGSISGQSPEDVLRDLQERTDASRVNVNINSSPAYSRSHQLINVMFANPEKFTDGKGNIYKAQCALYIGNDQQVNDGSAELFYSSATIRPGQYVETDSMQSDKPIGEYSGKAVITYTHPDTDAYMGKVLIDIVIHVVE